MITKTPQIPKNLRRRAVRGLSANYSTKQKGRRELAKSATTMVREAGLEPARPEWTLEPESSESANSTTRAFTVFQLLGYITTDIPACQADETEKVAKNLPAFFDVCNRMCCAGLYIQTVIRRLCIYQNIGILSIPWPHLDGTSLFPICLRQHWHPVRVYRVQRGLTKAV